MSKRELRPHQMRALSMVRQSISSGHRTPVLSAPTGFGKTVVMSTIARGAMVKGNGVLVTVPAKSLIDQTIGMFFEEGIHDIGVMQADHPLTKPGALVQVATVQTLARRAFPKFAVGMIDECHINHKHIAKLIEAHPSVPFIGFSATPGTKGLGLIYDDLLTPTSTKELIDTGFLSKFKTFAPSRPDLTGVSTVAGDYHEGQLSKVMQRTQLVADVVENWCKNGRGRKTLVFCVDRAHAQVVQEGFGKAGVFAEYIDAFTSREDREKIRKRMEAGEVEVVVNIGCLTTGCDWPFVSCVVLARPTKSAMLYQQIIGRGLRIHPGKDHCVVFDHSDTWDRLGFVTDITWDHLDDGKPNINGKRQKKPPEPRECVSCHAILHPSQRKCPECGHEMKVISSVVYQRGELAEVTSSKAKHSMADKQQFWSMIIGYSQLHFKNDKWRLAQYKQKFGVWPRGLVDLPLEPSIEVLSWIKSRNIAWAKSKSRNSHDSHATSSIGGSQ